ncbi:MAG TPA: nucleotidyltransferase domain-containing protein [Candidatus Kapabacteria bacterium]|nr:nucleotidyltransferase domain-containing protein [Candidatus Kapabacteria bacterium]
MKNKIIEKITQSLSEKPGILFAYLFGSFLSRDDFEDIDIGIFLDPQIIPGIDTLRYELELSIELEDHIKVINDAPVTLRYSVSTGKLLFSKDENTREEFLCRTWPEYFDFQYILDTYYKEVIHAGL